MLLKVFDRLSNSPDQFLFRRNVESVCSFMNGLSWALNCLPRTTADNILMPWTSFCDKISSSRSSGEGGVYEAYQLSSDSDEAVCVQLIGEAHCYISAYTFSGDCESLISQNCSCNLAAAFPYMLERPAMYFRNPTVAQLSASFAGFECCRGLFGGIVYPNIIDESFEVWIRKRLNTSAASSWQRSLEYAAHLDERYAYILFFKLIEEFRSRVDA